MPTTIVNCDCPHEFQDKTYGKNKRAANIKDAKPQECTCTVCGKIRPTKVAVQPIVKPGKNK